MSTPYRELATVTPSSRTPFGWARTLWRWLRPQPPRWTVTTCTETKASGLLIDHYGKRYASLNWNHVESELARLREYNMFYGWLKELMQHHLLDGDAELADKIQAFYDAKSFKPKPADTNERV